MTGFMMIIHALICIVLVTVILMQSGRGGGLTEACASAASMFGAQTNEFMIKMTTIISVLFLVTCLSLAVLSAKKGKSLMTAPVVSEEPQTVQVNLPKEIQDELDKQNSVNTPIPEEKPTSVDQ